MSINALEVERMLVADKKNNVPVTRSKDIIHGNKWLDEALENIAHWIGTKEEYEAQKDTIEPGTTVIITDDYSEAGTQHNDLIGRSAANAHPISAITGLQNALDGKADVTFVTPQMFGAVGDGEHDDTEALQSALNSHYNIFIPNGTYKITKTLGVVNSGTRIIGENKLKTVIKKSGTTGFTATRTYSGETYDFSTHNVVFAFVFPNNGSLSNTEMKNLNLQGAAGFYAPVMTYSTIKDIRMTGRQLGSFYGWCNIIENVNIYDCGSTAGTISGLSFMLNKITSNGGTLYLDKTTGVVLNGCSMDNGYPSYYVKNGDATLVGCSCETSYEGVRSENATVSINGGDYEGHVSTGTDFYQLLYARQGGKIISRGAKYHFENYYPDLPYPEAFQFTVNDGGIIDLDTDIDYKSDKVKCWRYNTGAYLTIDNGDKVTVKRGIYCNKTTKSTIIKGASKEIFRCPVEYRNNRALKLFGRAYVDDNMIMVDVSIMTLYYGGELRTTIVNNCKSMSKDYGEGLNIDFECFFDNNNLIVKAEPTSGTFTCEIRGEWI